MTTALLIGRYQPLHLVHLTALDYAVAHYDKVVVLISNKPEDENNWFSQAERQVMFENYLSHIGIKTDVVFGTVQHQLKEGEKKIENLLESFKEASGLEKPDCLILGYDKLKKGWIKDVAKYCDIHFIGEKNIDFCATDIRESITKNKKLTKKTLDMIPKCNHVFVKNLIRERRDFYGQNYNL